MATSNDPTESTEHKIEGTREAREAAEEIVADAHGDADELEQRLESEGLTPSVDEEE